MRRKCKAREYMIWSGHNEVVRCTRPEGHGGNHGAWRSGQVIEWGGAARHGLVTREDVR